MAKLQTKSENINPYRGLFSIFKTFDKSRRHFRVPARLLPHGRRLHIVGIENRDDNTNVKFHRKDTLEGIFGRRKHTGFILPYE